MTAAGANRETGLRVAIMASHGGSNMQAIINEVGADRLPISIRIVISNNSGSGALERARKHNLPWIHMSGRTHPDPENLDREMLDLLKGEKIGLIVMAGYMKRLGPEVLDHYRGRIINIHPSLLPRYGGRGMFGIHPHESVLQAGDRVSGATAHVVTADYDEGPILAQREVEVLKDDTPGSLQKRVLAVEHRLYTEVIGRIASGEIKLPIPG
jgi:phosphoribosylglycinamide formyltransferase-1